jgi:hypothetical protein
VLAQVGALAVLAYGCVVSGDDDRTLQVWGVDAGRQVQSFVADAQSGCDVAIHAARPQACRAREAVTHLREGPRQPADRVLIFTR